MDLVKLKKKKKKFTYMMLNYISQNRNENLWGNWRKIYDFETARTQREKKGFLNVFPWPTPSPRNDNVREISDEGSILPDLPLHLVAFYKAIPRSLFPGCTQALHIKNSIAVSLLGLRFRYCPWCKNLCLE